MKVHNNLQTQEGITAFLEVHIPNRMGILMSHKELCKKTYIGDPRILNACFIASLVVGRVLLNMLGIGKNSGQLGTPVYKSNDVNANDLGFNLVSITELSKQDKDDFLNYIIIADRASAH